MRPILKILKIGRMDESTFGDQFEMKNSRLDEAKLPKAFQHYPPTDGGAKT
jgi:hypothetical protein